ncbi:MAG: hypothetical protein II628_11470, partial [Lachnospiraceae bacterium]|nr:hypothetical protein [Lachnospiraceae bacterium]
SSYNCASVIKLLKPFQNYTLIVRFPLIFVNKLGGNVFRGPGSALTYNAPEIWQGMPYYRGE